MFNRFYARSIIFYCIGMILISLSILIGIQATTGIVFSSLQSLLFLSVPGWLCLFFAWLQGKDGREKSYKDYAERLDFFQNILIMIDEIKCEFSDVIDKIKSEFINMANLDLMDKDAQLDVLNKLEALTQRIVELQAQTANTEPITTVNAAKWEGSVSAAFEVWAEIIQGEKTNWIEEEFRIALAKRFQDYHTKVHALAWSALPDDFKSGRGRPPKNRKNPNSP